MTLHMAIVNLLHMFILCFSSVLLSDRQLYNIVFFWWPCCLVHSNVFVLFTVSWLLHLVLSLLCTGNCLTMNVSISALKCVVTAIVQLSL